MNPPKPNLESRNRASTLRAPVSHLAVAAIILAVMPCCPLVNLLGAALGMLAWRRIQLARGTLGGRRLARAATFAGLMLSLVTALGLSSIGGYVEGEFRQNMVARVEDALRLAADGRIEHSANLWLNDPAVRPALQDIADFGSQTRARYGSLRQFKIAWMTQHGPWLRRQYDIAGNFSFDQRELTGTVSFQTTTPRNQFQAWPEFQLLNLIIHDAENGDLRLPRATADDSRN